MKKAFTLSLLILCFAISAFQESGIPHTKISNGLIKARLYLPDSQNGYYRGTRFDWSGQIASLTYLQHDYYGQWFAIYNPTNHDAIMGPVEEYAPLNYDETNPGSNFIKIGVGVLRSSDKRYDSFSLYEIVNPGTWKIKNKKDRVQFIHFLNDEDCSYVYTKTIQLQKGKPVMVISHSLKNIGHRPIETNVYNHNFFVIDNQLTGSGFVMTFPVNVTGKGQGIGTLAEFKENKVTFLRDLESKETIYCGNVEGFGDNVKDFDIKVENLKTGAGVRITGDQPLLKLVLWAASKTLCPETYIDIKVEPGKEFKWDFNYEQFQ